MGYCTFKLDGGEVLQWVEKAPLVLVTRADKALQVGQGRGNEVGGGTPEEFAAFIATENKRWGTLVKTVGIKMD